MFLNDECCNGHSNLRFVVIALAQCDCFFIASCCNKVLISVTMVLLTNSIGRTTGSAADVLIKL